MFNALDKYDIEPLEYGFVMEDSDIDEDSAKVMLPKLTPLMTTGGFQEYKKSYNPNIFVNTSDSKPAVSNNITIRNFITIKKFKNITTRKFNKGDKVICSIMNKDIKDIYLTDFI